MSRRRPSGNIKHDISLSISRIPAFVERMLLQPKA